MNNLLTEVVVIATLVALPEQYRHALRHIDPQKSIEVSNYSCEDSQSHGLGHSVIRKVPATESGDLQVEFHDDGSIQPL